MSTNIININKGFHNTNNYDQSLLLSRTFQTRKQNRSMGHSGSTTSSALALIAFLFFLNMLQRSLDDNKQKMPIVMTRTTTPQTIPRNEQLETENTRSATDTNDGVLITKLENSNNKYNET